MTMINEREWTISQRAYRLGKLMGRGQGYTTEQIREMLGYSNDSSVYNLIGALVDEQILRDADGLWVLCDDFQNPQANHVVSK